jgi:hypothetical protein
VEQRESLASGNTSQSRSRVLTAAHAGEPVVHQGDAHQRFPGLAVYVQRLAGRPRPREFSRGSGLCDELLAQRLVGDGAADALGDRGDVVGIDEQGGITATSAATTGSR